MNRLLIKKVEGDLYILADKFSMFKAKIDKEAVDLLRSLPNHKQGVPNSATVDFLGELYERGILSENETKIQLLNESPLLSAQIELTRKCNLHCSYCYQKKDSKIIPKDGFKRLIDYLDEYGVLDVCLHGGEVFLMQDIWEYLSECKNKSFRASIITNGTLLGENEAQKISQIGISAIFVSLDGPPTIHDSLRGKGTFKKTIEGIEALLRYNITTYINSTPPPQHFEKAKYFLSKLASDLKVAGLRISRPLDTSLSSPYPPYYPLCEKHNCYYRGEGRNFIKTLYVTADGFAYRCPFLGEPPIAQLSPKWEFPPPSYIFNQAKRIR